jgi:glycosyltransferase involved in cell wall biosynthesis
MPVLILKDSDDIAKKSGFNSAIITLCEGFDELNYAYTFDINSNFDVIIANDYYNGNKGVELKRKTGKPLIASIHLSHPDMEKEKTLIDNCNGIITYSNIHANCIVDCYRPNIPIKIVTLGINTNKWSYQTKVRESFVLFVGRLDVPAKAFSLFATKCLNENIKLKVAGNGVLLENIIERKYMNNVELEEAYNTAQLHVLPSFFEPFGLVTLEAMACGCPVAVSKNSGVAELLNNKIAILFDPYQPFSVKEFIGEAKHFDSNEIRDFAIQFNHINYAKSFITAVNEIVNI